MSLQDEVVDLLNDKLENARNMGAFRGRIGFEQSDGSVQLRTSDMRANEVWVTFNDDPRQVVVALCLKVKKAINAPVIVQKNIDNRWEIVGTDNEPAIATYGEAAPDLNVPDQTTALDKSLRPNANLTRGRVRPATGDGEPAGLNVVIEPFHYDAAYFPKTIFDLTSYLPATANTKAWVIVGVQTSTNAAYAVTGAEYGLAFTMTEDLISDITVADGVIPLWAWVLTDSETSITPQTPNSDFKFYYDRVGGSGGSSPWTTDAGIVNLVTDGDKVTIGSNTDKSAKLAVDGDANEVQLLVEGSAGQTTILAVFQDSDGNHQVSINIDGSVVINEEGNEASFRVEGGTDNDLISTDPANNRVGIGTANPTAKFNVEGGGVIINDAGADNDVRIESNNDANNFFSDGGSDNIGIGTGTPDANTKLQVVSTTKTAIPRPVMTAAQMAAITGVEGARAYASDTEMEHVYDGQRYRNSAAMGWQPYAYPINFVATAAFTTSATLATNGGSIAIPILITGQMDLESVSIRELNAASARTWGWDLYVQYQQTLAGDAGENTLTRVVASNGNETFTPGAASTRTLAAAADTYLGPGLYWLVVQCRHATNSIGLGSTAASAVFNLNSASTKTTSNPNGASLDFVAATWTRVTAVYAVRLNGVVFGQTAAF